MRARDGPARFGLPGLSLSDAQKVHMDTVLWFRMLVVYAVAVAGRHVQQQELPRDQLGGLSASKPSVKISAAVCSKGVLFGMEHPEDPSVYQQPQDDRSAPPSIWAMPEIQSFRNLFQSYEAHFHQGALGQTQAKPSRFMTSVGSCLRVFKGSVSRPTAVAQC